MTEEVRNKMLAIYEDCTLRMRSVLQVFIDQFDEINVDNDLPTFEEFLGAFDTETLGSMGITSLSASNTHGHYRIDAKDYKENGRGKSFLEYIPDLGILDYLSPDIKARLITLMCKEHPESIAMYITIRFPKVTVTNEYDKSVEITELYVRVKVEPNGTTPGTFAMTRAEYTVTQWMSDYAHSHLSGIDRNHPERFRTPCTGSGPVNRTIGTLYDNYDLNIWGLYAFEIAKYVTVESISGVPYRRLENIGRGDDTVNTYAIPSLERIPSYRRTYSISDLKEFIKVFIATTPISIAYREGNFVLGESFTDFWVKLSNSFIKWHNHKVEEGSSNVTLFRLLSSNLLKKYIIADGLVYNSNVTNRISQVMNYEGRNLFMFKGNMIRLHFIGNGSSGNLSYLVDDTFCYYVLSKIIEIISYNYGREERREEGGEEESNTSASARCYYA